MLQIRIILRKSQKVSKTSINILNRDPGQKKFSKRVEEDILSREGNFSNDASEYKPTKNNVADPDQFYPKSYEVKIC